MAITLTSYPVQTEAGKFLNAFAGFNPIELEFTADAGETSVECVLVDPTSGADLLGFSLFADFNPSGVAVVDVSILVDNTNQSVLLASQNVSDSRLKYRVKYREAGTIDDYILIDGVISPIIAVHSIEQFELDKWLTPEVEPVLWLGYPVMGGFVHSDANTGAVSVAYDLLDIQKSIIGTESVLFNYGSSSFGLNVANLQVDTGVAEYVNYKINGAFSVVVTVTTVPDVNTIQLNVSFNGAGLATLIQSDFSVIDDILGALTINTFTNNGGGNYTIVVNEDLTDGTVFVLNSTYSGRGVYSFGIEPIIFIFDEISVNQLNFTAIIVSNSQPATGILLGNLTINDLYYDANIGLLTEVSPGSYELTAITPAYNQGQLSVSGTYSGSGNYDIDGEFSILNSGGLYTTDWINPTNGLAESWNGSYLFGSPFSVITGSGFVGNAQRSTIKNIGGDVAIGQYGAQVYTDSFGVIPANNGITLEFKFRTIKSSLDSILEVSSNVDHVNRADVLYQTSLIANGLPVQVSVFIPTHQSINYLAFRFYSPPGSSFLSIDEYFEIDEVKIIL